MCCLREFLVWLLGCEEETVYELVTDEDLSARATAWSVVEVV